MAHIVRVWLVTPTVGFEHPKTVVLRVAARRGKIALRAQKVDAAGAMRVVGRGVSDDLAEFRSDLYHKARDLGWQHSEVVATAADVASISGGGVLIVRSEDSLTSGVGSSGRGAPSAAASDTSSIDTGSTASSSLVVKEVKIERERNEKILAAAAAAAAAREAAMLEAAAAREAAALEVSIVALMTHANMTRDAAMEVLRGGR